MRDESDQHEIVAVHHGVSELVAQEPPELRGVAAEHLRDLLGVEAREPASQMRARLVINPHRVSGGEFAVNLHDAGGEQTRAPASNRLGRTGIRHQGSTRVGREADPQPTR